jgi:hypothetical protein
MRMIKNADVVERLGLLIGMELTNDYLHEVLFCEGKHKKIRVRFNLGKQIYTQFKVSPKKETEVSSYADISILGNPNTFRIGVEEIDGKVIVNSAARVSYTYL